MRLVVLKGMEHLRPTYSYFSAGEEVLRIARGELPWETARLLTLNLGRIRRLSTNQTC